MADTKKTQTAIQVVMAFWGKDSLNHLKSQYLSDIFFWGSLEARVRRAAHKYSTTWLYAWGREVYHTATARVWGCGSVVSILGS